MERLTQSRRPVLPAAQRTAPGGGGVLRRCGGVACRPGSCDHDGQVLLSRHRDGVARSVGQAPEVVHRVLSEPGRPLDLPLRSELEQRFGYDFARVRIHSGELAARSAQAVQASAYTVGQDVVLGAGQSVASAAGRGVLMHELAHVVQNAAAPAGSGGLTVGAADDLAEHAADRAADAAERVTLAPPASRKWAVRTAVEGTGPGPQAPGPAASTVRRQPAPGSTAASVTSATAGLAPSPISSCRIEFRQGTTDAVDPAARDACLETARAYVAAGGIRTVELHGYASEEGDPAFNADLARRRADTVKRSLVGLKVPDAAISAAGHGVDRTYPGLAPNRRVEVVLVESLTFPGTEITIPKYICGPDVTKQAANAVAKARSIFAGWTPAQRDESCEDLRGVTTGSYAWDIVELHNNAWILDYRPLCATQGATPPCGSTVQVSSECYYAGSPNYVIFGTMCQLCYDHFYAQGRAGATPGYTGWMDFTESSMADLIDLYKSSSGNTAQSKSWAVAGRDGWPSGGTPPKGDRPGCAPQCSQPYQGPAFQVNWYPYEFHTGGGSR